MPVIDSIKDDDSGVTFSIVRGENGKFVLDCRYNLIKIDIRNYDLTKKSLKNIGKLITSAAKLIK